MKTGARVARSSNRTNDSHTREPMVPTADALIIGGGAIGICCAHYLNALGKKVLVVEKNEICSGSSYGNAGLIVPSYSIPMAAPGVVLQGLKWMFNPQSPLYIKPRLNRQLLAWLWRFRGACNQHHVRRSIPVLHELHSASLRLFEALTNLDGMNFAFVKKGILELFNTHKGFEGGRKDIRLIKEYGINNRLLPKNELNEYLGSIRTAAVGGAYFPHDAHLMPDRFVHQLARCAEKGGVRLLTACEVIDFETSGRYITRIKTTRGDILASEIIFAGGAWSSQLVRRLQIELSMQPAKGYSITFKRPQVCPALPVALAEAKVVLTPMADTLRLAGTLELAGFDESIRLNRLQAIIDAVKAYFPDMDPDTFEMLEIWRGLRPCSPDGLPYIGRPARYNNVIIATGHGMLGISLAPITGKIVSQLASNQTPSLNIAALDVDRFG